jgi:hypothetical protein
VIGFWIILVACTLFYAIMKEREELGCYRVSIARQCDDEDSVYVKGTHMEEGDNMQDLYARMMSILSYHEKAGVWKRCVILATILVVLAFLLLNLARTEEGLVGAWIMIYLMFCTVMYFFFNYMNYHHFRNLKRNGQDIMDRIMITCDGRGL